MTQIERVELLPDTDLRSIVEHVGEDGTPRIIERDGKPLAVVVSPEDFLETAQPRSRRLREQLLALAGVWSDLDADAMIDEVYRARHELPPSPPPPA
jgi:PHD/YefM family antitoxin component YafN of YafNO toxin-antitoxin module